MATDTSQLTWEHSNGPKHPIVSDRLPSEVVTCLQNARFLHLATCTHNIPHVSLMNYTYLPAHPFPQESSTLPSGPTIIMTTNPDSKKTANLVTNPNISLLVHEWVSSRPPNASGAAAGGGGGGGSAGSTGAATRERSPAAAPRSSLAAMLMEMNSTAVSSISATINGEAIVVPAGTEEEAWCREQHLANNTFETDAGIGAGAASGAAGRGGGERAGGMGFPGLLGGGTAAAADAAAARDSGRRRESDVGDGGRGSYIEDRNVRVIAVRIRDGRISDWKGGVKDFVLASPGALHGAGMVNGVGGRGL